MPVTTILMTPEELEAVIERAVARVVDRKTIEQADASGAEWGVSDVAAALGVSTSTVLRMERRNELPKRAGRTWRKADVLRARKEAAEA